MTKLKYCECNGDPLTKKEFLKGIDHLIATLQRMKKAFKSNDLESLKWEWYEQFELDFLTTTLEENGII